MSTYLVTVHAEPPHEPVTYRFVAPDETTARRMARERARAEHRAWRSMDSREVDDYEPRSEPMAMLPNCHHPGSRCSCQTCMRLWPEERQ